MRVHRTAGGYGFAEFRDVHSEPCTIAESDVTSQPCIELGISPDVMVLTQHQVAELLPLLAHFVACGKLTGPTLVNNKE